MARTMRLFVQIPCLNEEATISQTIAAVPRQIEGFREVRILVLDDGSEDRTAQMAVEAGADIVLRRERRGYLATHRDALDACLALDADLIVNSDGDHQYPGRCIPDLVRPVRDGLADLAIGDRRPGSNPHFPPMKRLLQRLGSWSVARLAGIEVCDAASGFRAFHRDTARRLRAHGGFSPTAETLIQAGHEGLRVAWVPIETHAPTRPSRLMRNSAHYVGRQILSIVRASVIYRPMMTFGALALPLILAGGALGLRFAWLYTQAGGGVGRYIHSLTLAGFLIIGGLILGALGLIGDALLVNRRLAEEILARQGTPSQREVARFGRWWFGGRMDRESTLRSLSRETD